MPTKDQLLLYLKESKGNWISGESISTKMAVSRSAIWKHIQKLREEGYVISSSSKKGYLLRKTSDMLLPSEIREGLTTTVFGKGDIVHFRETDSTNTRAKALADRGAPEGTVIVSEKQIDGRGRKGRNWFSPSQEGIYISLILRPALSPGEAPKTTLLTAVAVAEALISLTGLAVSIKWPNDILVHGKKIAGILTEISAEIDAINYIVVGLGLNVNTPDFPSNIKDKATSMFIEAGKHFSRVRVLREYLIWYERYYDLFWRNGFDPILTRWKELANIIGRRMTVETTGTIYTGEIQDIDKDGVLILKDNQGKQHRIFSGDISLV
jgi:BirA family biotin operon repressor/biotin-[acetyl-CoA-carboxylase] ligase